MRVLVLFNLKAGIDPAKYEAWAAQVDLPTVRGLPSIEDFRVHALTGHLMGDGKPPFQYAEILDVGNPEQLGKDISTPEMQAISTAFREFADNPIFITTREIAA